MAYLGSGKLKHHFKSNFRLNSFNKASHGFTLVELMVVVMIIAILAAIATPSYRRYVVMNAERETQAKMLQLQLQLERWRASALTYKGFKPQVVSSTNDATYAYDDDPINQTIYVPTGSDATNHRYKITLVDGNTKESVTSLISTKSVDSSTGRTWKMLAEPNTTGVTKGADIIMINSTGTRCKNSAVTITAADCGEGQESW